MEPSLVLLLITIAMTIVIDLTDFVPSVKRGIWRWVFKDRRAYQDFPFKPFECSLCMSFWLGLGYLIIWGQWTLPLMVLQLWLSIMTPQIKDILMLVKDFINKIIDTLYGWYNL